MGCKFADILCSWLQVVKPNIIISYVRKTGTWGKKILDLFSVDRELGAGCKSLFRIRRIGDDEERRRSMTICRLPRM